MTDHQAPPPAAPVSPPAEDPALDDPALDLARVAADLDGVETALRRLDEGTYWTDEVTGDTIADEVLTANPVARRSEAR